MTLFASMNRVASVEGHNVVGCPAASINGKERELHSVCKTNQIFKAKDMKI